MMKFKIAIILILCFSKIYAQSVTLSPSGVLVPSMTTTARTALTATNGQLVYDTTTKSFWYYNGSAWKEIGTSSATNSWTVSGVNQYSTPSGNVGVGTSSPTEKLHIEGGNLLSTGTFGTSSTLSVNGAGTRMFFYPKKAAFRAGYTSGVNWNDDNIGNYSVALGNSTVATGESSTAFGTNSLAGGSNSFAVGSSAIANATSSVAIGKSTVATGEGAFAIGNNANANGAGAISLGNASLATGNNALSLGNSSIAGGNYSNALGYINLSGADYSLTLGTNNFTQGQNSIGLGTSLIASSFEEVVVGAFNESYSQNSTSEWDQSDRVFVVGNGSSSSSRSNAMTILKSGNTGIGTNSPSEKFEVNGRTKTTDFQMTNGANSGFMLQSDANGNANWVNPRDIIKNGISNDDGVIKLGGALTEATVININRNDFSIAHTNPTGYTTIVTTTPLVNNFSNIRKVYQTFTTPSSLPYNAHLSAIVIRYNTFNTLSDNGCTIKIYKGTDTSGVSLSTTHINLAGFTAYEINNPFALDADTQYTFSLTLDSTPDQYWLGYFDNNPLTDGESSLGPDIDLSFEIRTNNYSPIIYTNATDNYVGIGKNDPSEILDVAGKTKTTNLQITNGASNGYILQSDANGNANWVNSSSIESDPKVGTNTTNYVSKWDGTKLTTGTIFDNGNIGIGTSTPSSKFEVVNSSAVDISVKSIGGTAAVNTGSANANDAGFYLNTVGNNATAMRRWGLGKANNSETGGNTGSYFVLNRYNDNGSYLGQPIMINRTTGTINIGNEGVSTTATTIDIKGSVGVKVKTVINSNNTTTLDGSDYMVIYGGTITNNTLTIPQASSCSGRIYFIINHSSSAVAINGGNSYITSNGVVSTSIAAGASVQIVSDSTNWHKIN